MQCFGAESTVMLHKIGKIWARMVCPMCMNQKPGATAMLIVVLQQAGCCPLTCPCGESNIFKMSAADFLGGVASAAFITPAGGPPPGAGPLLEGAAKGSSETCCGCCCGAEDSFTGVAGAPTAKGSAPSLACAGAAALLCTQAKQTLLVQF